MNWELHDAILNVRRLLRTVSSEDLDGAFQYLASIANTSEYARQLEPTDGLALAVQAAMNLRVYMAGVQMGEDEIAPEGSQI